MRGKVLFLSVVFFFGFKIYGQVDHPPEPTANNTVSDQPCDYDDDLPPPPGLPCATLPIDDYIIPLLIVGIIFGSYKVHKIERV
jgi:hypothetical protein